MKVNILVLDGSPVQQSSTELLLLSAADATVKSCHSHGIDAAVQCVRLNDLTHLVPCQSCGKAPNDEWCFFHDALTPVLDQIATADAILMGSPIHFDSVSAQAKILIDRCNCFRPADFEHQNDEYRFLKRLAKKRPGGMVLVGGPEAWFEGARRCLAGWFKWIEVESLGLVQYHSADYAVSGTAKLAAEAMNQAENLGRQIGHRLANSGT